MTDLSKIAAWGTTSWSRELLYVEDVAKAIVHASGLRSSGRCQEPFGGGIVKTTGHSKDPASGRRMSCAP